jgi:hypothetical protein
VDGRLLVSTCVGSSRALRSSAQRCVALLVGQLCATKEGGRDLSMSGRSSSCCCLAMRPRLPLRQTVAPFQEVMCWRQGVVVYKTGLVCPKRSSALCTDGYQQLVAAVVATKVQRDMDQPPCTARSYYAPA